MFGADIYILVTLAIFILVFIFLHQFCTHCVPIFSGPPAHAADPPTAYGVAFGIRSDDDGEEYWGWDRYAFLSTAKRQAIDEMRSAVIARYVGRFSLALGAGQLGRRAPGEEEGGADSGEEEPLPRARATAGLYEGAGNDGKEGTIASTGDSPTPMEGEERALPEDAAAAATTAATITSATGAATEEEADTPVTAAEEEEGEYTHVRVPFPGYDRHGVRPEAKKAPARAKRGARHHGCRLLLPRHFPLREVPEESRGKANTIDDDASASGDAEDGVWTRDARRDVPAFCAICLGAYAPADVIAWSSNPDCPHVYHRDCLVRWLQTLGRTTKFRRFTDPPSVGMVLEYGLTCPCCRQDFISKDLALEEEGERKGAEEERAVRSSGDDTV